LQGSRCVLLDNTTTQVCVPAEGHARPQQALSVTRTLLELGTSKMHVLTSLVKRLAW